MGKRPDVCLLWWNGYPHNHCVPPHESSGSGIHKPWPWNLPLCRITWEHNGSLCQPPVREPVVPCQYKDRCTWEANPWPFWVLNGSIDRQADRQTIHRFMRLIYFATSEGAITGFWQTGLTEAYINCFEPGPRGKIVLFHSTSSFLWEYDGRKSFVYKY